jgi:hypothetical protein
MVSSNGRSEGSEIPAAAVAVLSAPCLWCAEWDYVGEDYTGKLHNFEVEPTSEDDWCGSLYQPSPSSYDEDQLEDDSFDEFAELKCAGEAYTNGAPFHYSGETGMGRPYKGVCWGNGHQYCEEWGNEEEEQALLDALASGDVESAVHAFALMEEPSPWYLNQKRRALQKRDCTGDVIRHIPVTTAFVLSMAEFRQHAADLDGKQESAM